MKQSLGTIVIPRLPITRRLFEIIRREINSGWVRINNLLNPLYLYRRANLRRSRGLCVNIGCGPSGKAGWVNLDLMKMPRLSLRFDCRTRLPLSDASVKRIRCEHFLEHLEFREEAPYLLKSCLRVLECGGVLRIVVPDAAAYLRAYSSGEKQRWLSLGWDLDCLPPDLITAMDVINHVFHQGGEHLYGYDFETLAVILRRSGFKRVTLSSFGASIDPELRDDLPHHGRYSLYVDAVK